MLTSRVLHYTLQPDVLAAVQSGAAKLVGAVIKSSSTGQIIAHVQPTAVAQALAQGAPGMLGHAAQMANPLGAAGGLAGGLCRTSRSRASSMR